MDNNISIVKPDATDAEVYDVARSAAVHDVVMSFDKGYDTIVGERGVTLSGGQQQRVAIARTLMQKAPILIFDAKIRDALYNVNKDGVVFLISHRVTTLCEADNILVLEKGRLVEQGTHEELLNREGLYRRIAVIQDAVNTKGGQADGSL